MIYSMQMVKEMVEDHPEIFDGLERHCVADFLRKLSGNLPIFNGFCEFARELKNGHRERYSFAAIMQRLRWETYFREEGEEYKLNNSHVPCYGRLVLAFLLELRPMFKVRYHDFGLSTFSHLKYRDIHKLVI